MNFLLYLFIVLLSLIFSSAHRYPNVFRNNFLNYYQNQRERQYEDTNKKFGSSKQNLYRPIIPHHQAQSHQNPMCLPHVWTCGPHLPPCCPGLMCYAGNAKRGQFCVAKG